jgi:flagellar assembly protein FliH
MPSDLGASPPVAPAAVEHGPSETDRAWHQGFAEGARQGRQEADAMLAPAAAALRRIVERLQTAEASFAHDRVRHLEALAVAIARQLLQRELTSDPGYVRERVDKALELVPRETSIQIRLHPLDLDALRVAIPPDAGGIAPEWIPDGGLERGDFVIDTPNRVVDGRTDVALRALFERLDDA